MIYESNQNIDHIKVKLTYIDILYIMVYESNLTLANGPGGQT